MPGDELESGSTAAPVVDAGASVVDEVSTFNMEAGTKELSSQLGFGEDKGEGDGDGLGKGEKDDEEGAASAPAKTPEQLAADKAATEAAAAAGAPGAEVPKGAPKTWTKEASAVWDTLPETAKAEILRREEDMFKGIEGYKVKAAFGASVDQVLEPFRQSMTEHNVEPIGMIRNLLVAHHTLALGTPEQKVALYQQLGRSYGLMPAAEVGDPAYVDPQVAALQQKIARLESGQAQADQQRQAEARETLTRQVNAFANDPKNPHFDDCVDDIVKLVHAGETLESAYQKAVWLNPVTRAKEIARLDAEKQSQASAESASKLADAKAATAANVRTKPKAGTAAMPLGTMDDTMSEVLKEIKSR